VIVSPDIRLHDQIYVVYAIGKPVEPPVTHDDFVVSVRGSAGWFCCNNSRGSEVKENSLIKSDPNRDSSVIAVSFVKDTKRIGVPL
jgi:hypothetical protein